MQERNEIFLRKDKQKYREKYIAHYYFKAKMSRKIIDLPWIGFD
jgi:hypothetical protein